MKRDTIKQAIKLAGQFILVAEELEKINKSTLDLRPNESVYGIRKSAELKRVSMDLSHTLADLRLNR